MHRASARRTTVLAYSIASFADKQLELGAVLLAFHYYGSLRALVLTGLVFQATKVATFLIRIPASPGSAVIAAGTAVVLLEAGARSLSVFLAGTALFTLAVSYLRAWTKDLGSARPANARGQKQARDVVRACGFVLAPLFSPVFVGVLTVLGVMAWARAATPHRSHALHVRLRIAGSIAPNHVAMFVHHVHFFTYSHVVPFIFAVTFGVPAAWQGLIFYLGWVGYDLHDFVRIRASWPRFLVGHLAIAAGIFTLFWAPSAWLAAVGWLVTGIGGGTYVMLRHLTSASDPDPAENLELAEHYGHVVGMLVLVGLLASSVIFSGIAIVASSLAVLSPVLALWLNASPQRRMVEA
jgi:hypothetical protein